MGVDGMLMNIFLDEMQGTPIDDGHCSALGEDDMGIFAVKMEKPAVNHNLRIIANTQVSVEKQAASGRLYLTSYYNI